MTNPPPILDPIIAYLTIYCRLPEGWSLPAYFTVIIQFANLGPLCYGLLRWVIRRYRLSTDSSSEDKLEMVAIYLIIIIGALATFLLSFYWDVTSIVGKRCSVITTQFIKGVNGLNTLTAVATSEDPQ